jgi:glycosyltransferase involved in cell wall biosynthesis
MPSRSDAFGVAFLEAWASNTPVIGANIGATPEVIKNNRDGLLVEFDNPKDIAEKVLILLENSKLKNRLAKNGNKKVMNKFTWKKIAKNTFQFYQKLISEEKL